MVYYSEQAEFDMDNIVIGMLEWEKHKLTFEHIMLYRHDLRKECDKLDTKPYHFSAIYEDHLQYGSKMFAYKRNPQTT